MQLAFFRHDPGTNNRDCSNIIRELKGGAGAFCIM